VLADALDAVAAAAAGGNRMKPLLADIATACALGASFAAILFYSLSA
jgi:hypothetical protein